MRRSKPKTIRSRGGEFTKQATIWMKPDRHDATRHRAIDERSTFQAVVDRALELYLETTEPAAN